MKTSAEKIDESVLFNLQRTDLSKVHLISKNVNAEGMVLLENNGMLPLKCRDKVAVFGRMQNNYIKSGWGSGGLVAVEYCTNIMDCLLKKDLQINNYVLNTYRKWGKENPVDYSDFGERPRNCEGEMQVSLEMTKKAAEESDKAIVILGRTEGEDFDIYDAEGSYRLLIDEYQMLGNIRQAFENVCVVINSGSIIDMKWAKELNVDAVLYVWQGGQDGGAAVADVLCGDLYPSGKLSDTIAWNLYDYPAYNNFGNDDKVVYGEDIYVGYRYFETFAKDCVIYPFGFGLSYTEFDIKVTGIEENKNKIIITAEVKNIGTFKGKETIQVYYKYPGKKIYCPDRELVAFTKTNELLPGEQEIYKIEFDVTDMAKYDEFGMTGNESSYVLEDGDYEIFVGSDVRSAIRVYSYKLNEILVTKRLSRVLAPKESFDRFVNISGELKYETVEAYPSENEDILVNEYVKSVDVCYKLKDVYSGRITVEDFIAQLCDRDLACLSQGEGMCSTKVRPGTAGAIGGLTDALYKYGIPAICVVDGPSGLRFDNKDIATSIPNGTMMACTWNTSLIEELYSYIGMEAYINDVDGILAPGVNIHRHPLCGRNFEYFSEDPYLSGKIGISVCSGISKSGVTATPKHFAANNQEHLRAKVNSVVSERALREIYLKPFEMIIKDKKVNMIMTGYNLLNGVYCCSNYELTTKILRDEWGYEGIVITDWWASTNCGENRQDRRYPIIAQADVYMVSSDCEEASSEVLNLINDGFVTRAQLQRNAVNICNTILKAPGFKKQITKRNNPNTLQQNKKTIIFSEKDIVSENSYLIEPLKQAEYILAIEYSSNASELEQLPIQVNLNERVIHTHVVNGTGGNISKVEAKVRLENDIKENKALINLKFKENITISKLDVFML